jgi:hypothetical protein
VNYIKHFADVTIDESLVNIPKPDLTESSVSTGLEIFFGVAAAVAVLIIAISAFKMTVSRGNAEDVKKARDAIVYASIGLAITLSGFVIVAFVLENI